MFHELLSLENEHISSYFIRGSRIVVFATTFVVEIKRCIMDPAQDGCHFSSRVNTVVSTLVALAATVTSFAADVYSFVQIYFFSHLYILYVIGVMYFVIGGGNVYSWGSGHEGQLGHGPKLRFSSSAQLIPSAKLRGRVVQVACGEAYSAAVTGKNLTLNDVNGINQYEFGN